MKASIMPRDPDPTPHSAFEPDDDLTVPEPARRGRWGGRQSDINRGHGPGSTASGVRVGTPPEVRPPPGNVVLL